MKIVQLVPGHGADQVLEVAEGIGRARNVQHEAAHRVAGEVHGGAAGHAVRVLAQHLKQGAGAPVQPGGGKGADTDAAGIDGEAVSLLPYVAFLEQGEGDVRLTSGGNEPDLAAQHVFQVSGKGTGQLLVRASDGDGGTQLVFPLAALPLQDFRDNPGLGIALRGYRGFQDDFIILADGLLAALGHFEAEVYRSVRNDRSYFPFAVDEFLVVGPQELDLGSGGAGHRQLPGPGLDFRDGEGVSYLPGILSRQRTRRKCGHH